MHHAAIWRNDLADKHIQLIIKCTGIVGEVFLGRATGTPANLSVVKYDEAGAIRHKRAKTLHRRSNGGKVAVEAEKNGLAGCRRSPPRLRGRAVFGREIQHSDTSQTKVLWRLRSINKAVDTVGLKYPDAAKKRHCRQESCHGSTAEQLMTRNCGDYLYAAS